MFEYSVEQEAPYIWVDLVGKLIIEDDAKEFKYQCKEKNCDIIWRGVDIFGPGEGPGRWRNEDARSISSFQ